MGYESGPYTLASTDTIYDNPGDLVVGTGADTAAKLAITVPAANILNVLGVVNGETTWSVKSVHDATAPAAVATAAAAGTALTAAHRDHAHLWTGSTFAAVAGSGVPKLVRRTGDATAVQTSVLANDDTLLWAIAANEVWFFQGFLLFTAVNTTMDWQVGFSVPSGCTMSWGQMATSNAAATSWSGVAAATTPAAIGTAATAVAGGTGAVTNGVTIAGVVVNSSTAGNVNLQWAQATTNANNLFLAANSLLILWRLA